MIWGLFRKDVLVGRGNGSTMAKLEITQLVLNLFTQRPFRV